MKIKRHYKRFRYILSWKFPRLYDKLRAAKFPFQLGLLCLATFMAVEFYNNHFSFAAAMQNSRVLSKAEAAVTKADSPQIPVKHQLPSPPKVPIRSMQSNPAKNLSPDQMEATLINSEVVLQRQVEKAERLLRQQKQRTKELEQKLASAKSLLRTSDQHPLDSAPELFNADWLQAQPANHYIVQVAAGTERKSLLEFAADKRFDPPLALYPYKLNKDGELVYGLSTGLFIAKDDAFTELPGLSEMTKQHGVWVRKVADINNQLSALKQTRTVH